jgi:hypothetical protein
MKTGLIKRPDMIPRESVIVFLLSTMRICRLTGVVAEKCISKTAEAASRKEQALSLDRVASTDFAWSQLPL